MLITDSENIFNPKTPLDKYYLLVGCAILEVFKR